MLRAHPAMDPGTAEATARTRRMGPERDRGPRVRWDCQGARRRPDGRDRPGWFRPRDAAAAPDGPEAG